MSGKGKRRREARRRSKQRQEEQRLPQGVQAEGGPERAAPTPREERRAAREEMAHSGAGRKKARRRGGLLQRVGGMRVSGWMIGVPVVVIGGVVLAVLILTSGSSGGGVPKVERTPDPRVAGQTPTASFNIEASDRGQGSSDSFFNPTEIRGKAGDVIELVVKNTGTVSHNLRVSGPNKTYDVDTSGEKGDDFEMPPNTILPGKTERLVVKINEPGTYPFRCDFHPQYQKGTLILE
ncbi:MAG: cupredoxin domain-containing protein [Dehalococcoidia bacterium]|nr:cupredoxin domain-containing protein [Dehalococcoidia bacterium]